MQAKLLEYYVLTANILKNEWNLNRNHFEVLEKLQASAPAAPLPTLARIHVWIRRVPAHSG